MVTTEKPKLPQKDSHSKSASHPQRSGRSGSSTTETEKLRRAWRSLVSSFLVSTRCAEKQIAKVDMGGKELDESIEQTLKARNEFRRYITTVEAKLLGTAKETEAINGLVNTQSRLGRKRKFDDC